VFASLVDAAALHSAFWIVLGLACVNTVISLWYYVNVLRVMTFYPRPADAPEVNLGVSSWPGLYLLVICLPVVVLGILIQPVSEAAAAAARSLFP
jgi:NADH:ubiquinone oxidoreductase subunit 2 (subunit N)